MLNDPKPLGDLFCEGTRDHRHLLAPIHLVKHTEVDWSHSAVRVHPTAVLDRMHAGFNRALDPLGTVSVRRDQETCVRGYAHGCTEFVHRELRESQRRARRARPSRRDDLHDIHAVGDESLHGLSHSRLVRGEEAERAEMTVWRRDRSPGAVNSRPFQLASINRCARSLDNVTDAAEIADARDARPKEASTVRGDAGHQLRIHQLLGIGAQTLAVVEAEVNVRIDETGNEVPVGEGLNLVVKFVTEQFNRSHPLDPAIRHHHPGAIDARTVAEENPPGGDEAWASS